jgi:hypothetical protein
MKHIILSIFLFTIGQLIIWFQTNGQFIWPWAKEHPHILAILGWPISYLFISATYHVVTGFDGLLWPGRLLGFAIGIILFSILTICFFGEGINTKTITSLLLALALVFIQIFWK